MKGMSRSMLKLRERPLRKSEATRLFGWAQGRGDLERPSTQPSRHASDPAGGVKLTTGTEAVRCLHFSSRVFRWYTDCCRTPIANTAGPRFPVIGLIHSFMSIDTHGRTRDAVLGAPLCRIFEDSAIGPLPPNAPPPRSAGLVARRVPALLGWWLRGLGRPNPLFDEHTNAPLSVPRVFTPSERAALAPPNLKEK
jgi:Family of unknown function (DUF6151)